MCLSKMGIIQIASLSSLAWAGLGGAKALAAENTLTPEDYQALSACEKGDYLWDSFVAPTEYEELPSFNLAGGWQALLGSPGALLTLGESFSHVSDEMPWGRRKFIHPFGSVAQVTYEADADSPYTGLLAAPQVCGLVRLSLAGPPGLLGYTPGMALKLFVDGAPSVNLHVMHSLNGQGANKNFFEHPFSNVLEQPEGIVLQLLAKWFGLFVENPMYLSLDHVTAQNLDGSSVAAPSTPYSLVFVAAEGVALDPDSEEDLRRSLEAFEPGTVLYEVFARAEPDSELVHVGRLRLSSRFVASEWGDQKLFFQHHE